MTPLHHIAFGLLALLLGHLAVRLVLWFRYRPLWLTDPEREDLPTLTVVIPAFNEGAMVGRTIDSILATDYPGCRLRVIAVDDGSTDDTWQHIASAARRHPDHVEPIRLPTNRGKRHALYEGFSRATSDLVATVDSDSVVATDALTNLVAPLVRNPQVAGVAGKVLAENRDANVLTRMLGVRYILGFDLVRAYQSELRTVWCCPGALQAYRRAVITPHLDTWRDQRFLGAPCTNGDDHAMTNLVLSLGHDTTYQSNARVHTLVPTTYGRLVRMYIRWGRSATREGLRALTFATPRARRLGPVTGALMLLDALVQPLGIALKITGLFAALYLLGADPTTLVYGALATTAVAAIYALVYLRQDVSPNALFAILYAWFAMLALPWIQPFATLTVRRNGWLTRAP